MISQQQLTEMSRIDLQDLDRELLAELQQVSVNPALPEKNRLESFLEQVKNPYCYRSGSTGIKVEFSEAGLTLQELMTKLLIRKKNS